MLYGFVLKKNLAIVAKFPWDIGIVSFMLFPELMRSPENAVDRLRILIEDPFFDLIEVTVIDDNEWKKVAEVNTRYGKSFVLGLQPLVLTRGVNPSATDEEERKKSVNVIISEVKKAGKRGYKAVGFCSGPNVELDRDRALNSLVKTLAEVGEEANRYDMKVFLETFDVIWDRKRLLGSYMEAVKIVDKVREIGIRNVYVLWDLSHAPLLGEDPEVLRSCPEFLGHVHIGCAKKIDNRLLDTHPGFHRPSSLNTEVEVAKLLEVLNDIGYRGAISFEVRPEEGQNPMEVLNSAKGVLLRAFQLYLERV